MNVAEAALSGSSSATQAAPEAEAPATVLVVDLDGTLLKSDMIAETFWAAFSADWRVLLAVPGRLGRGRAALKAWLAETGQVDAALLPYNGEVLDYLRAAREAGRRVALVSASNQVVLDRIAAHLGLFDEVHGSSATRNLKGPMKAAFLDQHFGSGFYAYMGDHEADLAVWPGAAQAITVNASARLRRRVEALRLAAPPEHLCAEATEPRAYLRALRPHQWLKNALVFLPMLAAHDISGGTIAASALAFLAFSLVASSVYLLNDLLDLAADRAHPRKRLRPFAAGAIPIVPGSLMAPGLFLAGLALAAGLGWKFLVVMAFYALATTAYSLWLKRQLVIDICTLAGLYTLRILAGGAATGIALSVWLLAFSVFFFLSLAAVKRQAELVDHAATGRTRAHGRGYDVDDLPIVAMMAIAAGYISVMVMALYLSSGAVRELYSYPGALWGICLVLLYWTSWIVMITHRGQMHDDPLVYAVKDRVSQLCLVLILACVLVGWLW